MNRTLRKLMFLLVFTAGVAVGLGIGLYLALDVLMIDVIYPASSTVWA